MLELYLLVERPERLEEQGAEYEIIHGSVMSAKGLEAWAPRNLGVLEGLAFADLAIAAKAKGYALFRLPMSAGAVTGAGAVTEEHTIAGRKILLRRAQDWTGPAFVRYVSDEHGGVVELETPGWLLQAIPVAIEEVARARDETAAMRTKLETLEREIATLRSSANRPRKAPKSPATQSGAAPSSEASKSVADIQGDLARVVKSEAKATPKKKYRGSAGDD